MAVPQHHQHDQLELVQAEVFVLQRDRAVDDHFALDRGDHALLFGENQELARLIADALLFKFAKCRIPV